MSLHDFLNNKHPRPLSELEVAAVNLAHLEFKRVNYDGKDFTWEPVPITLQRKVWDTVQEAFSHWPTWLEGEPVVCHKVFCFANEPREHFLFKGVCCFPEETP